MDEDAGRSREPSDSDRSDRPDRTARRSDDRDEDESAGFSFSLPPISLPEVRLPERVRLAFPVPEPPEKQRPARPVTSSVLLALVVADALDAAAVALAGPGTLPWARAAAGTVVSILLVGVPGLLYAWELVAILAGFGWLSLAPTATLLLLAQAFFENHRRILGI